MAVSAKLSAKGAKRREIVIAWMRQLLRGQEQQGTAKAAAAAWLGTVYALRAAARLDGNSDWGRTGDEMIDHLEAAYIELMGKEGAKNIEAGRRLLQIDQKPEMPIVMSAKAGPSKKALSKPVFKAPVFKPRPKGSQIKAAIAAFKKTTPKAPAKAKTKAKAKAKAKAKKKGR